MWVAKSEYFALQGKQLVPCVTFRLAGDRSPGNTGGLTAIKVISNCLLVEEAGKKRGLH